MTLPHTLTNGTTASASQVQADLEALDGRFGNLKNADVADAAGIESSKLASPFTIQTIAMPIITQNGAALATGGTADQFFINQNAMTSLGRKIRAKLRTGQQAWLCSAEFYVGRFQTSGGGSPKLDLLVDGVQLLGQEIVVDTADAFYPLAQANPIDSPLMPITNDTIFDPRIGATANGAAASGPTIADVTLTLVLKVGPVP